MRRVHGDLLVVWLASSRHVCRVNLGSLGPLTKRLVTDAYSVDVRVKPHEGTVNSVVSTPTTV